MAAGDRIRQLRLEKGLTQKKLGELSGINESQIRRYELGLNNSNPKIETLKKIADALEVSIVDLFSYQEGDKKIIDLNPSELKTPKQYENYFTFLLKMGILIDDQIEQDRLKTLIGDYGKLNRLGKSEARKRVHELTEIERYISDEIDDDKKEEASAEED